MISTGLYIVRNNLPGYILTKFGNLHSFCNIKDMTNLSILILS